MNVSAGDLANKQVTSEACGHPLVSITPAPSKIPAREPQSPAPSQQHIAIKRGQFIVTKVNRERSETSTSPSRKTDFTNSERLQPQHGR